MRKKLFFVLLLIFFLLLGFRVFEYRNEYFSKYDAKYWEGRYLHSQWVDPNSKESIGDDGLYAFVGWEYIHGRDPTTINAEIPPFGKYLIGLTTVIFGNQNIFALLSGIFVLTSFFILNRMIFKNNFLAFLPVALFSLDALFYTQLRAPFLDLLYLGFLFMTFIFFLKKKLFISMIFLGCMLATKASATTFVLVTASILVYLSYMKDIAQIKKVLLYLPVSLAVFLTTYIVYFLQGHNVIEFLKVQKWILNFYAIGAKGDPISAFQILLTGNWHTWWGETIKVAEWTILWPASLLISIFCIFILGRSMANGIHSARSGQEWQMANGFAFLTIWIVIYLIFLAFIPVWPRYLLLLLPFMYTLFVWVLLKRIPWFSSD